MNKTHNPTIAAPDAADFHWPSASEFGFIFASALMPYLLACALLAS